MSLQRGIPIVSGKIGTCPIPKLSKDRSFSTIPAPRLINLSYWIDSMTARLACTFVFAFTFLTLGLLAQTAEPEHLTPLLLSVPDPPVPFIGSDQRVHLVYELWVTNFSSGDATIETDETLGDGAVLYKMETAEISKRLQPAGMRESVGALPKGAQALLFI